MAARCYTSEVNDATDEHTLSPLSINEFFFFSSQKRRAGGGPGDSRKNNYQHEKRGRYVFFKEKKKRIDGRSIKTARVYTHASQLTLKTRTDEGRWTRRRSDGRRTIEKIYIYITKDAFFNALNIGKISM